MSSFQFISDREGNFVNIRKIENNEKTISISPKARAIIPKVFNETSVVKKNPIGSEKNDNKYLNIDNLILLLLAAFFIKSIKYMIKIVSEIGQKMRVR